MNNGQGGGQFGYQGGGMNIPAPGRMPQGLGSLMGGFHPQPMPMANYGKPFAKEDNGSPPAEIFNPGAPSVAGNYGPPPASTPPPQTPPPQSPPPGGGFPSAPQAGATIPYSAQSYNQPFAPFQNFDQQAQGAFNPMAQTNVGDYGRFNPMTWQGIAGPWPQLFGGPGAPAQQSGSPAQQGLNAQFAQYYGRPRGL